MVLFVVAGALLAAIASVGYRVRSVRRASRWNALGLCACCARSLGADRVAVDGQWTCEACARTAKWRIGIPMLLLSAMTGAVTTVFLIPLLRWWEPGLNVGWTPVVITAAAVAAPLSLGVFALRRMQLRNRAAVAQLGGAESLQQLKPPPPAGA